jgi:hypothetical protein
MRLTPFIALVLAGFCLQASAATIILDDPVCVKTLMPEEIRGLKICLQRGAACTRYWPNQEDDLQKCDTATSWIRAAKAWPLTQRNEVFGSEWLPEFPSELSSPEPAWKRLPRSGNSATTPQFNIPDNASANPYAGTSAAITPEAAKRVGWSAEVLTGVIKVVGQIAQDMAAIENPESAVAAKEVLGSIGLGEYAASDEAIANGRKAAATNAFQRPDPRGCIKLTALVHDRMCGSPNDIRYEYINTCSYPVNYYFCSQGIDGKWRCDVSGNGNTRPNGKGMLAACNLTERYAADSCKGPCNLCGTPDLHPAYAERCGEDSRNKPE